MSSPSPAPILSGLIVGLVAIEIYLVLGASFLWKLLPVLANIVDDYDINHLTASCFDCSTCSAGNLQPLQCQRLAYVTR